MTVYIVAVMDSHGTWIYDSVCSRRERAEKRKGEITNSGTTPLLRRGATIRRVAILPKELDET
jgi:hypothetical protein